VGRKDKRPIREARKDLREPSVNGRTKPVSLCESRFVAPIFKPEQETRHTNPRGHSFLWIIVQFRLTCKPIAFAAEDFAAAETKPSIGCFFPAETLTCQ
jgi:hypothetical protein